MKVITARTNWDIKQLAEVLKDQLNTLFKQQRQTDIHFNIKNEGDVIEIDQPELYDGYLLRLTAKGNELYVAKSEHYVDDVNLITLLSILETLQMEHLDGADIVYISGE